ncbi:NACHT domain-containing protein [Kovacikia minuta CCNUW1]|uniref:nSTAND1 domain-containing NTPase n=1 Tax=Kovacikia minuta TaxID=2931930 RepID=UPI001CC9A2C8|nr:AAA family ATPase [Kovacikia minuta]UBF28522.1 NACHT domain-containing protein [Kovacikia minuta CCNUW1]
MSDAATTLNPTVDRNRFPSLTALRAAHSELLKLHREQGDAPAVLAEIEQLIHKGRSTGALLDSEGDRWAAQSLLDYWSSLLYRAGKEPPDASLVDFDPSLAPELSDDLCPFMGLEAFREKNQNLFFGRQRLIDKLLKHLETNRLLIVVGSSGSGKSSVVLGGLLSRLLNGAIQGSQNWFYYAPLVPGSNPLATLAQRLKPANASATEWISKQVSAFKQNPNHLVQLVEQPDHQPVVLIIDQFEEVFTLCQDDEARQALIRNLLNFIQTSNSRKTLILTMRTDFESQFVRTPDLLPLFEQSYIRVTALDAGELRETIEKPAEMVGLKFEEGLVDALLADVLGEPAALPLLQFTLLKLWDNREYNRVTWEAYRRLGGGRLALAKSADEFYNSLIPEEQLTVKRILLRMVRPTEGLEVTSNRIPRKELYLSGEAHDRVDRVLDKLIQVRLVRLTEGETSDDTQVEVAHEALIRNWPRLIDWLEDERLGLRQRFRLTDAAEQWQARGKDVNALWRGGLLQDVESYEDLSHLEAEFIQESMNEQQNEQQAEESRLNRELVLLQERLEAEKTLHRARRSRAKLLRVASYIISGISIIFVYTAFQSFNNAMAVRREAEIAQFERERALFEIKRAEVASSKAKEAQQQARNGDLKLKQLKEDLNRLQQRCLSP